MLERCSGPVIRATVVAVLVGMTWSGTAVAAQGTGTPTTHDSTPPRQVVLHDPVTVPLLHPNARNPTPQIMVMVNGKGPYRFDVETGAREINISHALAVELKLARAAGTDSDPAYHLDRIDVGAASFRNMTVEEFPAGVVGVDGVLGLPFFQHVVLTIDYPGSTVRISRAALPAADGRDILPLVRIGDFWGVPIGLAGKRFDAVLDTQNNGVLNLPPAVGDSLPFDGGLQVIGKARGVFGTTDVRGGRLSGDVTVGRYRIAAPFLDVIELPPDFPRRANLGSGFLVNFRVTLDQDHARLRLERSDTLVTLAEPARGRRGGGAGRLDRRNPL